MVAALLGGEGSARQRQSVRPVFPSTDTSVPQRTQDIAKAKQLLAAAGHPNGFSTSLVTEIYQEIPALAQVMKANLAKAGINVTLKIETQTLYYGKSTVGNSDWLDGTMSLVDYGDRGVPNVFLGAADLGRHLERGAVQEPDRTTTSSSSTWPRSTCRPRSSSPARSRTCCCRRRRS